MANGDNVSRQVNRNRPRPPSGPGGDEEDDIHEGLYQELNYAAESELSSVSSENINIERRLYNNSDEILEELANRGNISANPAAHFIISRVHQYIAEIEAQIDDIVDLPIHSSGFTLMEIYRHQSLVHQYQVFLYIASGLLTDEHNLVLNASIMANNALQSLPQYEEELDNIGANQSIGNTFMTYCQHQTLLYIASILSGEEILHINQMNVEEGTEEEVVEIQEVQEELGDIQRDTPNGTRGDVEPELGEIINAWEEVETYLADIPQGVPNDAWEEIEEELRDIPNVASKEMETQLTEIPLNIPDYVEEEEVEEQFLDGISCCCSPLLRRLRSITRSILQLFRRKKSAQ